ncbi:hypothetical protein [uncultured Microbulbifer sp.]|uniref:hypothetical protein n=1 Tax=uncultured Microbulbifer sp. TaxID=348147 RepID=UPI00262EF3E4|nr:hypothetical protein [uncultured Microbulbifer sp.]
MSFSTTIPLTNATEMSDTRRLVISLAIALGLHAALIAIPASLVPQDRDMAAGKQSSLQIKLVNHQMTRPAATSGQSSTQHNPRKLVEQSKPRPKGGPLSRTGASPATLEKIQKAERRSIERSSQPGAAPQSAPSAPSAESQGEPPPKFETYTPAEAWPMGIPADSDRDKSRSTVFNPKLRKRLDLERNKIRKFESADTEYATATGTGSRFVRQGDRCWDVKKTNPDDIGSDSALWFGSKCPNTSRSLAEIDQLAEKYGIP